MTGSRPFLLRPAAKDYFWGGNRINEDFGKGIKLFPLAETWECSTHPDGVSTVAGGEHDGRSLAQVLREHPEYLGAHSLALTGGKAELPILVKLIDASKDLSVQVHPDDAYAREKENGAWGKTEMWYILRAGAGAEIIYGFHQDVDAQCVKKAVEDGTIGRYLNHVPVRRSDRFLIRAGTVHAIGTGILAVEIQQNSNLTYRLYDYGRIDKDGKPRELDIDKAMEVADLRSSALPRRPKRVFRYRRGCASELLTRCEYFQVERLLIDTGPHRGSVGFEPDGNSFHALLCTGGGGVIFGEDFRFDFFGGDCVFVPAGSVEWMLRGRTEMLNVSC